MRVKSTILLLVLVLMTSVTFAQKSKYDKSLTQYWGKRHKPVVFGSNKKMAKICPGMIVSEYPYQGIGFKLGDPFAITYKLYISEKWAFSMDGGVAAYGLYKQRYTDLFNEQPGTDTLSYVNHKVDKDIHFSAKVSYYLPTFKFMGDVDMYVTLGWQFRFVDVTYGYTYEVSQSETRFGQSKVNLDNSGPEANFGFEYRYFDIPITAFVEVGAYYDIVQPPPYVKFQFGVGLRYFF